MRIARPSPQRCAACTTIAPLESLLLGDHAANSLKTLQSVPWEAFFTELSTHPKRAELLHGLTAVMIRDGVSVLWKPAPQGPPLLKNALAYADVMEDASPAAHRALQPALEVLLRYPVPALREALVAGLAKALQGPTGHELTHRLAKLALKTRTAAERHVFLAKLALLITAPEALDQAGVDAYLAAQRRFSSSGAKLRQLIAGILALGERPGVLRAVLARAEPTPAGVQRMQDLFCAHDWLQLLKAPVDDSLATDVFALQQAVQAALGEGLPDQAGARWIANMEHWRHPQHLVALAASMRRYSAQHPGDRTAWPSFRRLLTHLGAETYASARAASPQMAALKASGTDVETLTLWQAGAETTLTGAGAVWHLVDTDNANDFVNSGMDIGGSCMRVDDRYGHNRGLMGRLLDGSRRMMVLRAGGSEGRVLARAMWRLASDDDGAPVALLSRCYLGSNVDEHRAKIALVGFARQRGEDLGVRVACTSLAYPTAVPFLEGDLHLLPCEDAADYLDEHAGLAVAPVRLHESALDSLTM